eukprot:gene1626-2854_t
MRRMMLLLAFGASNAAQGPCDIFGADAHSVVRALFQDYAGPLYSVRRGDGQLKGGYANAAAQDAFCGASATAGCTIHRIYDQTARGNHLDLGPPGGAAPHKDAGVNATAEALTVGGHKVYAASFVGGQGYRNDNTSGVATGDDPETMYMVTAGKHYNDKCCFDYALMWQYVDLRVLWSAWQDRLEHFFLGHCGSWGRGDGPGPWVMADLENGLWAGDSRVTPGNKPMESEFVTAMVKGRAGGFTLKGGDAQSGTLGTLFDGPRPNGYNPMKKQGAIILGIGGDNSDWAVGTFYEGVMTAGYSSNHADDALQ